MARGRRSAARAAYTGPGPTAEDLAVASRIAGYHARRTRGVPGIEREDLEQEAVVGLLGALRRFQPGQGKWVSYRYTCIHGAIYDYLRAISPESRWAYLRQRQAAEARHHLEQEHGRPVTTEEVAVVLGWEVELVRVALAGAVSIRSLEEPLARAGAHQDEAGTRLEDLLPDEQQPTPEQELLWAEQVAELHAVTERLPHRERTVARGLLAGQPLKRIGRTLGVSEARVSQIVTRRVLPALRRRAVIAEACERAGRVLHKAA